MSIDPNTRTLIDTYLNLDEDDLYSLIPEHLPEYDHVQFHPRGQKDAGKRAFEKLTSHLYKRVCVEWSYCKRRNNPELQDSVSLVVAVADVITAICGAIPPFLIATLLVKKGLSRFCKCKH